MTHGLYYTRQVAICYCLLIAMLKLSRTGPAEALRAGFCVSGLVLHQGGGREPPLTRGMLTHSRTHSHAHTHSRMRTHTLAFTHMYTHTLTRTHVHSHSHTRTLTHTHTRTLTLMHMHIHSHAHTHAHTYTRTHTHVRSRTCTHSHTHAHTCVYSPLLAIQDHASTGPPGPSGRHGRSHGRQAALPTEPLLPASSTHTLGRAVLRVTDPQTPLAQPRPRRRPPRPGGGLVGPDRAPAPCPRPQPPSPRPPLSQRQGSNSCVLIK